MLTMMESHPNSSVDKDPQVAAACWAASRSDCRYERRRNGSAFFDIAVINFCNPVVTTDGLSIARNVFLRAILGLLGAKASFPHLTSHVAGWPVTFFTMAATLPW